MLDFEVPRWEQAKSVMRAAFNDAYATWEERRRSGEAQPLSDVPTVFYLDIPRNDVLDGHEYFIKHVQKFSDAGRIAALAASRRRAAALDDGLAHPDRNESFLGERLRWVVILNPLKVP